MASRGSGDLRGRLFCAWDLEVDVGVLVCFLCSCDVDVVQRDIAVLLIAYIECRRGQHVVVDL